MTPMQAMWMAIEEAKKGVGFVSPNPLVGCVILDSNFELLAKGYHAKVGGPHAEVAALSAVSDSSKLKGAHVFVTLEPCAHHGRTPPCAEALARLPLASVTYGLLDPNPLVAGKGIEILKQAGIAVHTLPELNDDLEDLAEIFLTNMREKRPFVAIKVASSLDGQIALKSGESQWITSEDARAHVQELRGAYDAVMVGVGTFLADNPKLNSRDPRFQSKAQKAVLLDPDGRSFEKLSSSALLQVRKPEHLFVVTDENITLPAGLLGVKHLKVSMTKERWDWSSIFARLFENEVKSVFVEGGGFVYSQLLKEQQADRLYIYIAPKILGAGGGLAWTKDLSLERLSDAVSLSRVKRLSFGPDLLVTGRVLP